MTARQLRPRSTNISSLEILPEDSTVEILCIFPIYIQHTTVYVFTYLVFRLHLSTAYITTAKIYIIVFYCLFQDNIWGFNMCLPIRCLGFYGCLCLSYAPFLIMIFLINRFTPFCFHTYHLGFTCLDFRVKHVRTYVSYIVSLIFLLHIWTGTFL